MSPVEVKHLFYCCSTFYGHAASKQCVNINFYKILYTVSPALLSKTQNLSECGILYFTEQLL